jgi:hypothetical protein
LRAAAVIDAHFNEFLDAMLSLHFYGKLAGIGVCRTPDSV